MTAIHKRATVLPAHQYRASAPLETHWQQTSCADVNCPRYLLGWKTVLDENDNELHKDAADHIRNGDFGRRFTEVRELEGLTTFIFEPGQECFYGRAIGHKEQTGRPAMLSRDDFVHQRGEDWIEDMSGTFDQLRQIEERG